MKKIVIIPLGTVSPYQKGKMNCPGFLVKYKDINILMDCGSGITRLLSFPKDLNNLYVIITHYHQDHFGDIGALQYASFVYHNLGLLDKKVKIWLPKDDVFFNRKAIISNPNSYSEYFDIDSGCRFIIDDLEIMLENNNSHTIDSYMIKLQNEDFKIVYTSDIGSSNFQNLVDFCKYSDLIICESSFLLKHNPSSNTHMTAHLAGLLAQQAMAKKLLLTHFWPEENKKLYLKEAQNNFEKVSCAKEGKKLVLRRF